MPTVPAIKTLSASSVDILNAIRNQASTNYRDYVPKAGTSLDSIRDVGKVIMDSVPLQNEFLNALVNRIGRVLLASKSYDNPWSMFKRGTLDMGETVEEVFVNIAKPFEFDPEASVTDVFKREIPDVRAAFHVLNYRKFYKVTVSQDQLRQAFLSMDGVTELVGKIVDSMYTSAAYDEFLVMKYMLAKHILNGQIRPVTVPTVSKANMPDIVSVIKGVSNDLTFMSTEYNLAGVSTFTNKEDQYFILNSKFDATMDVEVLAAAFNMDRAEFAGHRVLVDSFGKLNVERLNALFNGVSDYTALTPEELKALDEVPAVLVDRDWFMILDNMFNLTDTYNGQGLYWNYCYHTWKTFSVSPFANAASFVPGTPVVESVTVSPASVTVAAGQSVNFSAVVDTEFFAPQAVDWSVNDEELATIDVHGTLTAEAGKSGSVTVTAKSVYDPTKTSTASVTIS